MAVQRPLSLSLREIRSLGSGTLGIDNKGLLVGRINVEPSVHNDSVVPSCSQNMVINSNKLNFNNSGICRVLLFWRLRASVSYEIMEIDEIYVSEYAF